MITCLDKGLALFFVSQILLSCANTQSPGLGGSACCHPAMPHGFGCPQWPRSCRSVAEPHAAVMPSGGPQLAAIPVSPPALAAPGTFLKAADHRGPAVPAPRSGGSQSGSLSPAKIHQCWRLWPCLLGRSCLEGSHISSSAPGKGHRAPCSATQPGPAGNSSLAGAGSPEPCKSPGNGRDEPGKGRGGEATAASVPMH